MDITSTLKYFVSRFQYKPLIIMNTPSCLAKTLLTLLCSAALTTAASAAEWLPVNTEVILSGKVVGPISKFEEGQVFFKAFYLKLDKDIQLNDKEDCGLVKAHMLPILDYDMGRFKGKKVEMVASINCHTERIGTYAIGSVQSVDLGKR